MKTQVLLGLTGAATLAWPVAAVDLNKHNVRGPHDVTVLLGGIATPSSIASLPQCQIYADMQHVSAMAFGGMKPVYYTGHCQLTDIKRWEAAFARGVRARLGDPGRH